MRYLNNLARVIFILIFISACSTEDRLTLEIPQLIGQSKNYVLLRHKWYKGLTQRANLTVEIKTIDKMGKRKYFFSLLLSFSFSIKVIAVNKKDAELEMRISRIFMQLVDGKKKKIDFDSTRHKRISSPLKSIGGMLAEPIFFKSNFLADKMGIKIDSFLNTFKKYASKTVVSLFKAMLKILDDNAFRSLPKQPIKVGYEDVFISKLDWIGLRKLNAVVEVTNRVIAVDKDEKKLIEEVRGAVNLANAVNKDDLILERNQVGGWVLFDITNGYVEQSLMKYKIKAKYFIARFPVEYDASIKIIYKKYP